MSKGEIKKIIDKHIAAAKITGLRVFIGTRGVMVSGETFKNKETLKKWGARWNPRTKMWCFTSKTLKIA